MIHAFHMKRVMWGRTPAPLDAVVIFQSDLLLTASLISWCVRLLSTSHLWFQLLNPTGTSV